MQKAFFPVDVEVVYSGVPPKLGLYAKMAELMKIALKLHAIAMSRVFC